MDWRPTNSASEITDMGQATKPAFPRRSEIVPCGELLARVSESRRAGGAEVASIPLSRVGPLNTMRLPSFRDAQVQLRTSSIVMAAVALLAGAPAARAQGLGDLS